MFNWDGTKTRLTNAVTPTELYVIDEKKYRVLETLKIAVERQFLTTLEEVEKVGFQVATLSEIVDSKDLLKRVKEVYKGNQIDIPAVVATKKLSPSSASFCQLPHAMLTPLNWDDTVTRLSSIEAPTVIYVVDAQKYLIRDQFEIKGEVNDMPESVRPFVFFNPNFNPGLTLLDLT